ncbi:uroporphyrinogen-III C-methyltransferase [Thiotrichales bacterium 19S9-12]|nr:uroporphyrinogen-III C-methyltransferase [Thiotrichales bacterium 19S9-11]MCF6812242.1 uroporphyrinogen-III C-methyltransferase [Thiotrichales bacterium 19S9-12]
MTDKKDDEKKVTKSASTSQEKPKTSTKQKAKTEKVESTPSTQVIAKQTKKSLITPLALIVGLVGCGIASYSIYTQQQQKSTIIELVQKNAEYEQLNDQTTKVMTQIANTINDQQSEYVKNLQDKEQIQSLVKKTYALDQQVKSMKSDYLLPQSDLYQQLVLIQVNSAGIYLNMANHYLALYAGANQAISLIEAAESALVNADARAKPALEMVRKAKYAVENATLFTEYNENMNKLNKLSKKLNKLTLKLPSDPIEQLDGRLVKKDISDKSVFMQSLDKLSGLVKVNKLDQIHENLLSFTKRENLIVTLNLMLEQAKWALQRRDSIVFKENINNAVNEVKMYYQADKLAKEWLIIANSIQYGQSDDYTQAMSQAMYAVNQLESQILTSSTLGDKK